MVLIIFSLILLVGTLVFIKYLDRIPIVSYVGWVGDRYVLEDIISDSQLEVIKRRLNKKSSKF